MKTDYSQIMEEVVKWVRKKDGAKLHLNRIRDESGTIEKIRITFRCSDSYSFIWKKDTPFVFILQSKHTFKGDQKEVESFFDQITTSFERNITIIKQRQTAFSSLELAGIGWRNRTNGVWIPKREREMIQEIEHVIKEHASYIQPLQVVFQEGIFQKSVVVETMYMKKELSFSLQDGHVLFEGKELERNTVPSFIEKMFKDGENSGRMHALFTFPFHHTKRFLKEEMGIHKTEQELEKWIEGIIYSLRRQGEHIRKEDVEIESLQAKWGEKEEVEIFFGKGVYEKWIMIPFFDRYLISCCDQLFFVKEEEVEGKRRAYLLQNMLKKEKNHYASVHHPQRDILERWVEEEMMKGEKNEKNLGK